MREGLAGRRSMRRRWVFIGAAILGAGLFGVSREDSPHHACTSNLGSFGSLTGDLAHNCGFHNTAFLAAIVATMVGVVLMAAALLIRS
jgi:hypothetical protein